MAKLYKGHEHPKYAGFNGRHFDEIMDRFNVCSWKSISVNFLRKLRKIFLI